MRLSYDLHLHSCLSPCGDNDMTPNNIVNMAILNGLDIVALTDHNSCKNCPAFCAVAKENGILGVPGMEVTTAEEAHVVCLFPDVAAAMAFDSEISARLPAIQNRPGIFGEQLILDARDEPVGCEERLLINATSVSVGDVLGLARRFGGWAFPAHVDKNAYSVLSNLGFIPEECGFTTVEVKNPEAFLADPANAEKLGGRMAVTDSDAHYLWDIAQPERFLELEACSVARLLERLRLGNGRRRESATSS